MPSEAPDETKTAEIEKAVSRGDVDLARLTAAMQKLVRAGKAAVLWEIDLDAIPTVAAAGLSGPVRPGDLTLGEQLDVLDRSGLPWHMFDPADSQKNAAELLTVLLAHRSDEYRGDPDKAFRVVCDTVTTDQFDDAHSLVETRPADPT